MKHSISIKVLNQPVVDRAIYATYNQYLDLTVVIT